MHELSYAGFWIRHLALVVDFAFLSFINYIALSLWYFLLSLSGLDNYLLITYIELSFSILIWISYFSIMHHKFWKTLWKMALWIKVVSANNHHKLWLANSFWRSVATIFSAAPFWLWFLWASWDIEKRAFHDYLASSIVVEVRHTPPWIVFTGNFLLFLWGLIFLIIIALISIEIISNSWLYL